MDKKFLIIAITRDVFFDDEAKKINSLFENGEIYYLHLRKPGASKEKIQRLIEEIDPQFYPRIKMHDHFELIKKYNLGGCHLNSRNPIASPEAKMISKSIHSLEEMDQNGNFEYFFISPIFDSISKEGYKSHFNLKEISMKIRGKKVIALGGVTPDKFEILKETGFIGAALCGYFFPIKKPSLSPRLI